MTQSNKMRRQLERRIANAVIADALKAGYSISVNDGEETTLRQSRSGKAIINAMFTTDENRLYVHSTDGICIGWVYFIFGNDGWDVVNDYTMSLEFLMTRANHIADQYS